MIPNKYPAFVTEPVIINDGNDLYNNEKALGAHEVIIRKSHTEHLPELALARWRDLLEVYQKRLLAYGDDPRFSYAAIFHNHGVESGSSVSHPHSQFIVSSIIPPVIESEIHNQQKFFSDNQSCLLCAMNKEEETRRVRIIAENDHFLAFIPYAARYPYEVLVSPKKHAARFENANEHIIRNLSTILHKVFGLMGQILHDPPLNFIIHTKPNVPVLDDEVWHWHIEITPRLEHWGGYEVGTGLIINTLLPERAAAFLRSQ